MRSCSVIGIILCLVFLTGVTCDDSQTAKEKENVLVTKPAKAPRQMEYISLIGTLLQQTSMLSSVDGVLLAATTIAASALSRARPLFVAGFFSYLLYAGTALLLPGAAARMGIVPVRGARSAAGGMVAEALMRSIQVSPVMNVITNVSVSVITDSAARIRLLARSTSTQLRWLQGRVSTWSAALQSTCVERFLCRVGRFTQDIFPTVATIVRTIGSNQQSLDSFAAAIVKGTSSSNCSLIYPDCNV